MTDRIRLANPFDSDIVANPNQPAPVDVEAIHRDAFQACVREYQLLRDTGVSRSILFHGPAGCGKTHLLARFRRWLSGELRHAGDLPASPAAFVAVRMEVAPTQVWRHLRRRFAEQLLDLGPATAAARAPLDILLQRFAATHPGVELGATLEDGIPDLSLDLGRVLEHYAAGRHRRLCRAWLKGDSLVEADLETLGVPEANGEGVDEDSGESAARRIVLSLTRLCAPNPVVFCFDQLEALGLSTQIRAYGPFARMGASLVDETWNSLLISSVLATYLTDLQHQSMQSDYQRIAHSSVDLYPLNWDLGRQLIEARLDAQSELRPFRPQGGVAPLRPADLEAVFTREEGRCPARRLIHEARRLFATWQGAAAKPPVAVELFLTQTLRRLSAASRVRSEPDRMDEVFEHGLAPAAQLAGRKLVNVAQPSEVSFQSLPPAAPTLIAICNQPGMQGFSRHLERLRKQVPAEDWGRLCLVRDPRLPVTRTAAKARQRLAEIEAAGGRLYHPDIEALAAVDAMRQLLSQATSGDLNQDGEEIPAQRVRAWLEQNLPDAVSGLFDQMLGGMKADPAADLLIELLQKRKVLALDLAARELGVEAGKVEEYARANPGQAGLLEGRTRVVFHVVPAAAGDPDARP